MSNKIKRIGVKNKRFKSQSGQLIIEAILLMVLFAGIATVIRQKFDDRNIVGALVAGPWAQIAGMMSNGVWRREADGYSLHPQGSVVSREGDEQ